ncbi:flagellar biosynthetic protein FliR [Candidatus Poribacteria bacterium]|nr:flagellar biosynthetic protein FliR [Candidatus Poribacteria bacterium]
MEFLQTPTLAAFLLVLFRTSGMMLVAPLFGDRPVPMTVKISLALVLALVLFPVLPVQQFHDVLTTTGYAIIIFKELLIGIVIGYAAQTVFAGAMMAGQLISFQMGLALARALDPVAGVQSTLISVLYRWVALMTFVAVGGPLHLLVAMGDSYKMIGFGQAVFDGRALQLILNLLNDLFKIAIRIAAPSTVVLFFTNSVLAIMGRAMPQMHIFLVGLPLTMLLGYTILALSVAGVVALFPDLYLHLRIATGYLLDAMSP